MDKNVFLWGLTPQEFQKMLINALEQVIEPLKPAKESRSIELLTRKETAELLRISLPTLAKWSEQGIIMLSLWEDGYITLYLKFRIFWKRKEAKHV